VGARGNPQRGQHQEGHDADCRLNRGGLKANGLRQGRNPWRDGGNENSRAFRSRPSLRKGEGRESGTGPAGGETPEGEKPEALSALAGGAGGSGTKTLRGSKPWERMCRGRQSR
jgi:hypothetical protein